LITPHETLLWLCAAYWAVAVALLLASTVATILQPVIAARRAVNGERPPVSIVMPVKALEENFERAQESVFSQDYPCFEVLASALDPDSPASRLMQGVFARHPETHSRFLKTSAAIAVSPKVDNLIAPVTAASYDVIFTKDANAVLLPDDLAAHMRQLTPEVGLVCAIPYGADPENFPAHVEASILNGPHARILYLASCFGQGYGVGKIMLFRRSVFLRAGGFEAISRSVGEDDAMAKAMARIGLRTVFSHRPVRQDLGRRSWATVFQRQLRWSVIRRDEVLVSFLLEPLSQAFPSFFAAYAAAPLFGAPPLPCVAGTYLLWLFMETLLSFVKDWRLSWAAPAVLLIREALMIAVWLRAWTTSRVVWASVLIDARKGASPVSKASAPAAQNKG
jgi:ceramide glucosyltransferase